MYLVSRAGAPWGALCSVALAVQLLVLAPGAFAQSETPIEAAPAPENAPRANEREASDADSADADSADAPDAAAAADPAPAQVHAPQVLRSEAPEYPPSAAGSGRHPRVGLWVTLDEEGTPTEVSVADSGGALFDLAAQQAVRRWSFAPATRDGVPFASRVRVDVPFGPPSFDLTASTPAAERASDADEPTATQPDDDDASYGATAEVELEALRRQERSASDFEIERDVLAAAPRREGADLLSSAPGFYVARPAGGAIGHRILVRGFDAEHGQDLALDVGGLPINLPSHIHGQGYADLGFLIPDVVSRLRVREGVSDPSQGDFAVAGSASFDLGVEERGVTLRSGYGSFGTFQQLGLWAPEDAPDETFGAVQVNRSAGFGDNRASLSGSAIFQVATPRGRGWRLRAIGFLSAARADTAGVVRADDVDAGRLGLYDAYPFATARQQNAANARLMAGVFATRRFDSGANAEVGVFAGADLFRFQQNFTGFLQESRTLSDVAGRGDLIEQRNRTTTVGLRGRYNTAPRALWPWLVARVELGVEGRIDWITQQQNLLDASVRNQTWDQRIDADIFATDLGLYGDLEFKIAERATFSVGARADLLLYEIDDRLGNFVPPGRPADSFIPGFRRSAMGAVAGPRSSLSVEATDWLTFLAAYGEGFRSPQARLLEDGERAPFTKVRSADVGFRAHLDEALVVTVAGYWTRLSDDVAFEAAEGSLQRISATRRLGAVAHVAARPLPWLVAAGSVTYVDAELLEPPPGSVESPNPPFEQGQNLPYVPPVVVRLDVGAHGPIGTLGGHGVSARGGVGFSHLSARPLPYGFSAAPVNLLDASAALRWGRVELGLNVFNLLGSEYAAFELFYVSDWSGSGVRSRIPSRHLQAGSPRTVMVTLELKL
ncbi:MAG: iron complex outermembrane receptor protein [Polyangiales bacterium]|jgi:iron complex outermembrane receptor protein